MLRQDNLYIASSLGTEIPAVPRANKLGSADVQFYDKTRKLEVVEFYDKTKGKGNVDVATK